MNKLSRFLVVAIAVSGFLFAFSQRGIERHLFGRFLTQPMLKPGETIDDMVITTGVENAMAFWDLCLSTKENERSIRVDCGELPYDNLAIGYPFSVMDSMRQCIDWKAFTWEMSLDGHPIDLEAFGVYDMVYPALAPGPLSTREAFKWLRLWDVVLVNPTPGTHNLQGQAQPRDGAQPYTWVVNFTVANPSN